jgi:hypothetical protein
LSLLFQYLFSYIRLCAIAHKEAIILAGIDASLFTPGNSLCCLPNYL